jgi:hypothetical protein
MYSEEEIIDSAFEYFRERGFPYRKLPVHVCMQEINKLSQLADDALATSTLGYQVADTYHPERFSTPVTGMKTPLEAFADDKILKRCLTRMLTKGTGIKETLIGGVGGIAITSGTQAAANFRPAYALKMYRKYCQKGDNVLDTSMGFGGRLLGYIASGIGGIYHGIDPNSISVNGNIQMAKALNFTDWVFDTSPVEDLFDLPVGFLNKRRGSMDFAFTSPPYFCKELYADYGNNQSWIRYKTGEQWKEKFLDKMMEYQALCLKDEKYSLVNIEDVTIKGKRYPLVEWCKDSANKAGFTFVGTDSFQLQKRIGRGHEGKEIAEETVLIFRKDLR